MIQFMLCPGPPILAGNLNNLGPLSNHLKNLSKDAQTNPLLISLIHRPYEVVAVATHKGIGIWYVGLAPDHEGRLPVKKASSLSGHQGEVSNSKAPSSFIGLLIRCLFGSRLSISIPTFDILSFA